MVVLEVPAVRYMCSDKAWQVFAGKVKPSLHLTRVHASWGMRRTETGQRWTWGLCREPFWQEPTQSDSVLGGLPHQNSTVQVPKSPVSGTGVLQLCREWGTARSSNESIGNARTPEDTRTESESRLVISMATRKRLGTLPHLRPGKIWIKWSLIGPCPADSTLD